MKKNSTKWNSRAEARLRQQTFSLGAKCASPGELSYPTTKRQESGNSAPWRFSVLVSFFIIFSYFHPPDPDTKSHKNNP